MFYKPELSKAAPTTPWFYILLLIFGLLVALAWQDWMLVANKENATPQIPQYTETLGTLG